MDVRRSGPGLALAAAALFGLSAPAAKLLAGTVDPWLLAGLLYLGSGIGLGAYRLAQRRVCRRTSEFALVTLRSSRGARVGGCRVCLPGRARHGCRARSLHGRIHGVPGRTLPPGRPGARDKTQPFMNRSQKEAPRKTARDE